MTSASELFYNRRWRGGRREQPEIGLQRSLPEQNHPDHCRHRRVRGDRVGREEVVDQRWRKSHAGRACDRLLLTELDSVWLERRNVREHGMHDTDLFDSPRRGLERFIYRVNQQLPPVAAQARARLSERLRGISSSPRRTDIHSRISGNDLEHNNGIGIADLNSRDSDNQNLRDMIVSVSTNSSVSSVQQEVYKDGKECDYMVKASAECSICLEEFREGDELNRLECGHRFHFSCLEPWLRSSRDCPYCRRRL